MMPTFSQHMISTSPMIFHLLSFRHNCAYPSCLEQSSKIRKPASFDHSCLLVNAPDFSNLASETSTYTWFRKAALGDCLLPTAARNRHTTPCLPCKTLCLQSPAGSPLTLLVGPCFLRYPRGPHSCCGNEKNMVRRLQENRFVQIVVKGLLCGRHFSDNFQYVKLHHISHILSKRCVVEGPLLPQFLEP